MPELDNTTSPNLPHDISNALISRQLKIAASIGGALLLALTAIALWLQWNAYATASEALDSFQTYRATLTAMEKVTAERGPANIMLSNGEPASAADIAALRDARARSDLALDQLSQRLAPSNCPACSAELTGLNHLRSDLFAARDHTDRLAKIPLSQRTGPEIGDAVNHMLSVVPQFAEIADAIQSRIIASDASGLDFLQMARFAAMLHENAGLLGSRFTTALAEHHPVNQAEDLDIEDALGHVDQLRDSIEALAASNPAVFDGALGGVRDQYFGHALAYVKYMRSLTAGASGQLPSTAEFAAQYSPLARPIVDFRDAMLQHAGVSLEHHRALALTRFLFAAVLGAILLGLLSLLVWFFRENVIMPFVEATRAIIAIAADILPATIQSRQYRGEVQALFDAVQVLKTRSHERLRLEHERRGLIAELTTQAETDALTGLLNRRAFESRARVVCALPSHDRPWFALIMFDIDHFKRINDTWGHPTGDIALKTIGDLCLSNFRKDDVVARVGGEEFAVLIETHNPEESVIAMQRFREAIANTVFESTTHQLFSFTVSFGIAFARRDQCPEIATLLARADGQLYKAKELGRNRVVAEPIEASAS